MKKTVRKSIALWCLALVLTCPAALVGENRVYKEKNEEKDDQWLIHRFTFESGPKGPLLHLVTDPVGSRQTYTLSPQMETLAWTFQHPQQNTDITATKKGNIILLRGTAKGKPIEKNHETKGLPWNQSFHIGLEPFVRSGAKQLKFRAIGTGSRGYMKITTFKVKRKGIETITHNGQPVKAVHVTISLSGLLSMFWTGHYWYRASDGGYLCYREKSDAPVTMTLVSEADDDSIKAGPPS